MRVTTEGRRGVDSENQELNVKHLENLFCDARGPRKVLITFSILKRPLWPMGIVVHICDASA